ncbi:MAG TPA: tetratricopeptide repeat protein [Kofleriaceae bacterium]|nr:tetratricopeptide repeat protein [Kofleriaceae bacterium]
MTASALIRGGLALLLALSAACAGADKKQPTTPGKAKAGDPQAMNDFGDPANSVDPDDPNAPNRSAGSPGGTQRPTGASRAPDAGGGQPGAPGSSPPDNRAGGPDMAATPNVSMPNYDPDPGQARSQVEQHLQVARQALATSSPDAETALREARLALEVDAANIDAAAMVAFAYYHKRLYDTAELVLDDLFKREAAKQNAGVYYVYGLVYDHTNRPDQAVLSFKKAVELNPSHASALVNLGVHQLQNTQYAEALRTFERLVNQFGRGDVVTLTSLGSAYRGHAADYPATSPDHDDNVRRAEAAYKRALQVSASYGPAYYNLGLLYLDNDPFPGLSDTLLRLNTSKTYFDQYKNMPGVDMKLYDDRMKDVTKAIKRAEKQLKKPRGSTPPAAPAPAKPKGGSKRGGNP